MRRSVILLAIVAAAGLVPGAIRADDSSLSVRLTVHAGQHDRRNTPVRAAVAVPAKWTQQATASLTGADGSRVPAQLVESSLLDPASPADGNSKLLILCWILPELEAGKTAEYAAAISTAAARDVPHLFAWRDTSSGRTELFLRSTPVLRYMNAPYDSAQPVLHSKPFHHLYDPAGKRFVTHDGGGGLYPHHQGLFYGFTRCTFPGGEANLWACHNGESQSHEETLEQSAGPVVARQRVRIHWNGRSAKPFAEEIREVTAFAVDGGTLLEWFSRLKSLGGSVQLLGDPQHAGFQIRADNEVSSRQKETYFLRPDGKGEPGVERNRNEDRPWTAMSFMLGDQRFTFAYCDSPLNPKPGEYGERAYGRFGAWTRRRTLEENGPPLELRYRVWLQEGEMAVERAAALAADFADPPRVDVVAVRPSSP